MKKYSLLAFVACYGFTVLAQPQTEVYLFDLAINGKKIELSNPVNISANDGYDNQPSFLQDGSGVLFASTRNGQTDIVQYNIEEQSKTWLTATEGSEYSPIQIPNGKSFTAILLETNGTQLLWQYPVTGGNGDIIVPELVIGYHLWYDSKTIYAFVLGNHPTAPDAKSTFQKIDVSTGSSELISFDIGRSIHRIPESKSISFIKKYDDRWELISSKGKKEKVLTNMPEGVEDMVWLNNGTVLAGKDDKLMRWHAEWSPDWEVIADLSEYQMNGITRLAVSPDQTKITVVINE